MIVGNDRAAAIAELDRRIASTDDWRLLQQMQTQRDAIERDLEIFRIAKEDA